MLPGRRVVTLGHSRVVCPLRLTRRSLLYVGSKIDVNVHGLLTFIREAWPEIVAQSPQARLEIAGGIGHSAAAAGSPQRAAVGSYCLVNTSARRTFTTVPLRRFVRCGPAVASKSKWSRLFPTGRRPSPRRSCPRVGGRRRSGLPFGPHFQGLRCTRRAGETPGDADFRRRWETAAAVLAHLQFSLARSVARDGHGARSSAHGEPSSSGLCRDIWAGRVTWLGRLQRILITWAADAMKHCLGLRSDGARHSHWSL